MNTTQDHIKKATKQTLPIVIISLILKTIQAYKNPFNTNCFDVYYLFLVHANYKLAWMLTLTYLLLQNKIKPTIIRIATISFSSLNILTSIASIFYWKVTGGSLDSNTVWFSISNFDELWGVIKSETPWTVIVLTFAFSLSIPLLLDRLSNTNNLQDEKPTNKKTNLIALCAIITTLSTYYLITSQKTHPTTAIEPAILTILKTLPQAAQDNQKEQSEEHVYSFNLKTLSDYTITDKTPTSPKHVFFFIFESTSYFNTSLYEHGPNTTPFLLKLSKSGYNFEQARAITPHTSKALVSIFCGLDPFMQQGYTENIFSNSLPACLPKILRDLSYKTAHFETSTQFFESRSTLLHNLGFNEFFTSERFQFKNPEKLSYFGHDDRLMLPTIQKWLAKNKSSPMFASILTIVSHHEYILPKNYPITTYDPKNNIKNNHLNGIKFNDDLLESFVSILKSEGIYEDSILVIIGDHGEGFGEHGFYAHDNFLYDEALRIPYVIHIPNQNSQKNIKTLSTQNDILITTLNLLGHQIKRLRMQGVNPLNQESLNYSIHSCWFNNSCIAIIRDHIKSIYFFDHAQTQSFDLLKDPYEKQPLSSNTTNELIAKYKENVEFYKKIKSSIIASRTNNKDPIKNKLNIDFQNTFKIIGYEILTSPPYEGGQTLLIDLLYEIKSPMEKGWELMIWCDECEPFKEKFIYQPLKGYAPASSWHKGQQIRDQLTIVLPRSDTPRTTTLYMGIEHESKGHLSVEGLKMVDGMAPILSIDALPSSY